jgi:hypothetical protein
MLATMSIGSLGNGLANDLAQQFSDRDLAGAPRLIVCFL